MSAAGPASVLFDGDDVAVRLTGPPNETLVVTFTPLNTSRPFAEAALTAERATFVSVISRWPHWWQTREMRSAIAAIQASPAYRTATRIVLLGSSMGATGALLHSKALGATHVLAFCPQFSGDPRKVPFEERWTTERHPLVFVEDDMAAGLSPDARIALVVDPREHADREHARLIRTVRPVATVAASFCGHFLPRHLQDTGLLGPVLRRLLADDLSGAWLRSKLRGSRRRSITYLCNLAEAALPSRRGVAEWAIARAEELVAAGTPPIGGPRGEVVSARVSRLAGLLEAGFAPSTTA